jgi:DnaK suppressor protein
MRQHTKTSHHSLPDPETAAALEAQLARQEADLEALKYQLKYEIAHESRDGRDSAEYSADQSAFGVNASLLEATGRAMRSIEAALERLHTASYGVCSDCDARISPARLEALPFADLCRDCQEIRDAEETESKSRLRLM